MAAKAGPWRGALDRQAIRQWALWTVEQGFDERSYADARRDIQAVLGDARLR